MNAIHNFHPGDKVTVTSSDPWVDNPFVNEPGVVVIASSTTVDVAFDAQPATAAPWQFDVDDVKHAH